MRPLEESGGIQGAPKGGGEVLNPFQPPSARQGSSRVRYCLRGAAGAAGGTGSPSPGRRGGQRGPAGLLPLGLQHFEPCQREGWRRGARRVVPGQGWASSVSPGRAPRQDGGVGALSPRHPLIYWVGSPSGYGLMLQPSSSRAVGEKKAGGGGRGEQCGERKHWEGSKQVTKRVTSICPALGPCDTLLRVFLVPFSIAIWACPGISSQPHTGLCSQLVPVWILS